MVFISSIAAQSGAFADHELTEEDFPTPNNAYGRSKFAANKHSRLRHLVYDLAAGGDLRPGREGKLRDRPPAFASADSASIWGFDREAIRAVDPELQLSGRDCIEQSPRSE